MSNNDLLYDLAFSYFPGIGPVKYDILLKHFGTAKMAFEASAGDLRAAMGGNLSSKFLVYRANFDFDQEFAKLEKDDITVLIRSNPLFPEAIAQISDPPICLFVKGDLSNFNWNSDEAGELYIAVVGTRKPTDYGRQITTKFARELSEAGAVIVSGMAMGVDALAHWAALGADGKTVAFLGCGVNIIYPWVNSNLYHEIIESGGLVVSEFPPDMVTLKGHFVARNRLISGLSKGILVAEGLKDSGSLITARYALAQGKDVFAPPSPITSDQSQAPNLLLKEGAKFVTSVEDILEEYGVKHQKTVRETMKNLPEEQKRLFQLLSQEAFTPDELSRSVNAPIYQILTLLSSMELSGIVEKNATGKYQIKA